MMNKFYAIKFNENLFYYGFSAAGEGLQKIKLYKREKDAIEQAKIILNNKHLYGKFVEKNQLKKFKIVKIEIKIKED